MDIFLKRGDHAQNTIYPYIQWGLLISLFQFIQSQVPRIILLFLFWILAVPGVLAQDPEDSSPQEKDLIPLSDISTRSEEVLGRLKSDYESAVKQPVVYQNIPEIDTLEKRLTEVKEITQFAVDQQFGAEVSEGFITKWDDLISQIDQPFNRLIEYSKNLESIDNELNDTRDKWQLTLAELDREQNTSQEARERIKLVLEEIKQIEAQLNDSLENALNYQNKLVDLKLEAQSQKEYQQSLLQKELGALVSERVGFIWQAGSDSVTEKNLSSSIDFYQDYNLNEARKYLREQKDRFFYLIAIFIGFLLLLFWINTRLDETPEIDQAVTNLGRGIFKRPIFTALFFTGISAIPFLINSPGYIALSMVVVILVSFVFLVPVVMTPTFRVPVYIYTLLYLLFISRDLTLLEDHTMRVYELALNAGLLAFLIWFRLKQNKIELPKATSRVWFSLLKFITPVFIIGLVIALAGNILGYIYLSYLITDAVVRSFYIAIVFGAVYSMFITVFILFLHTSIAVGSRIIENHRHIIIKRSRRILQFLLVIFWLRFTLDALHLLTPSLELLDNFLALGVKIGELEISVGSFFRFALIIVGAWLISNLIRLLLQHEILSRMDLSRGVPMAIASLTYYLLIVIGFVLALIALGFDLTHLSVVAGALGIGIGFGLQNVVNNFISGLILIFERPITVGDIVDLQTVEGQVINIGIRSSKVKKYDGSVLIIPNADLISNQVVNYTLTDERRRFILPIYTNTEADPARVLELMTAAAREVDEVMRHPEPKSYFTGTEEQSRVFKLYYWVSGFLFLQTKSDVSVAVHKKLAENDIVVKTPKEIDLKGGSQR